MDAYTGDEYPTSIRGYISDESDDRPTEAEIWEAEYRAEKQSAPDLMARSALVFEVETRSPRA